MAEKSFPFPSMNGDRKYGADDFQMFERGLFTNGIVPYADNLAVTPGTGMNVVMATGLAFIEGAKYINPEPKVIPIDPADAVLNRIDRIVLRRSITNRNITAIVLKGVPGSSPTAPAITRDTDGNYDLATYDITIGAAVTSISAGAITPNILNDSLCGVATARTDFDLSPFSDQFNALLDEIRYDLEQVVIGAVMAHASTHASGEPDAIPPASIGAAAATHAAQHASDGSDPIPPASLGAAELVDGIVKASQAKTKVIYRTASFTADTSDAEALQLMNNASAAVITLPNNLPIGTSISAVRWATGSVTFAYGSGASGIASNGLLSISAAGNGAIATVISNATWWIRCE